MTSKGRSQVSKLNIGTSIALGLILAFSRATQATAQQIPDQTLGRERSRVQQNVEVRGRQGTQIGGGAIRDTNLFHSFRRFDVQAGQRIYFTNPSGINSILVRVTGSSASTINGVLGVAGDASLFLLNSNGILFGENARLDIRGAFVATTAAAIHFADQGSFSATDPDANLPLLTVQPSALLFNTQPQPIVTQQAQLESRTGLALLGGRVQVNGGLLQSEGQIALGGLAESGQIAIAHEANRWQIDFPTQARRSDVVIDGRRSIPSTASLKGNQLTIHANQIQLDRASLRATPSASGTPGSIQLEAQGAIELNESGLSSVSFSQLNASGNVGLKANGNVTLQSSTIDSSTFGSDDGGSLVIRAHALALNDSSALLTVTTGAGNAGNIFVYTDTDITLRDSSHVSAATDANPTLGLGDGGEVIFLFGGTLSLLDDSYVTAISRDQGESGTVLLTQTNPTRSATEPLTVLDAQLIDRACSTADTHLNKFVITGRGGISPNPTDSRSLEAAIVDWASLPTEPRQEQPISRQNSRVADRRAMRTPAPSQITEAQGWIRDKNNTITLVTQALAIAPQSGGLGSLSCNPPQATEVGE
ncbi:MAG: filamentous hemagglutinin N-terminal domain-containing protein [Drouetiella hepatica Uher 2000/2452]|jgi:filamentous hemagglutinin family protein|uniref:Filamentous hemagglutinin N-terminal domain-containing protein n=1 Tax=Drouetiella hepatica Uher 2000/2452 TaxID=904376 RepID=A0A951QBV0_9CYAN|nr:filamentous hemagglutinin N-terminal domain-containing protein [Drouetiella hepatica Uher 2000/2452]